MNSSSEDGEGYGGQRSFLSAEGGEEEEKKEIALWMEKGKKGK